MAHMSLPLMLEDGSSLDWPKGKYEAKVGVAQAQASILHDLSGVPSLERSVEKGFAKWAAEIRCPKTLLSRIELSREPKHTVKWRLGEIDGVSWIIPGLLAVKEFELNSEDLSPLWKDETLRVPPGWWLIRGTKRKVKTLAQSLLKFRVNKKLGDGQMQIQPEEGSGQLQFVADLAPDIWPERTSRTLQIAALIGVCGHFPTTFVKDQEDEPAVAREIRDRLEMANVPVWTEDGYDPALAATAIERFHRTLDSED